jgi:uncharacterized protein (UPF0264 family)
MTRGSMRALVSVRNVDEARIAADAGVDFIDLKEPAAGALGGLPVSVIAAVVHALRSRGHAMPISATIGDRSPNQLVAILDQVAAVGACGVDHVKVGIEHHPEAGALIEALGKSRWPVVPVLITDQGLDAALLQVACSVRPMFAAVMVDTAAKSAGSVIDRIDASALRAFIERVQASGAWAGVAGALRLCDVDALIELAPDFAGFRSAVCEGDRATALSRIRLHALLGRLREAQSLPLSSLSRRAVGR